MAIFKIDVPDKKLEFILELFNNIKFLKYQAIEAEPTADISERKKATQELISTLSPSSNGIQQGKSVNDMDSLMAAIKKVQDKRTAKCENVLFRFPHSTESNAVPISSINHLRTTIESYFRTSITGLSFHRNRDEAYEMDRFKVIIKLSDESEVKAGYCNAEIN
ncbi:hypothetical protein [Carboxylicivirga sp. M1479]|uniref:hypothetical protein n=1 Tax=Carboxylicivirga sp. M1479 TaxID=2594476 RepID=UPI001177F6A0|nr:hypothetical protein [Carboxylicivirga sp. M1479]TRX64000.1 hypothetical protein FNN09_18320 [Carboxylicivirga sp. M1479]